MRSRFLSVLRYDGANASLLRMNLLLAGVAVVPALLEIIVILSNLAGRVIDIANLLGLIAGIILAGEAEAPLILVFPILIAGIYGPRLWRDPDIPVRVRRDGCAILGGALSIMILHGIMLSMEAHHGRFRGLFM
jgi:hypothetical protein